MGEEEEEARRWSVEVANIGVYKVERENKEDEKRIKKEIIQVKREMLIPPNSMELGVMR